MGAWIALVLVGCVVGLFVAGDGDDTFDVDDAERCGRSLASAIGLEPTVASARFEDDTWRISVGTGTGALTLLVRPDGEVLEAQEIRAGGAAPLARDDRLTIFERGC